MTQPPPEPRNLFYLLLLVVSVVFAITALAYAIVPTLEDKAREAGAEMEPSPFRTALREDGWKWLLIEVAVMIVLGLLSMGLDRLRRLKKEREDAKITPRNDPSSTP